MARAAVIGTTSWGTTLAVLMARNGGAVRLLARRRSEAEEIERLRENRRFVPGVELPEGVSVTESPAEAMDGAGIVFVAVPSRSIRTNLSVLSAHLPAGATLVSATKGLEVSSGKRMTEVMAEEIGTGADGQICALSGPNLAAEVVSGLPSTTVVAGPAEAAASVQAALSSQNFRVYTNSDVVGVELGGALKNIVAIGAGVCDGLKLGDNSKAAFVTRGLAETARLGIAAGADPLTFAGLAGMGDMMATCYSALSRNRHVGQQLAGGHALEDIRSGMRNVAEGIDTTVAAVRLADSLAVDMPIARAIHAVMFEGISLDEAISDLLGRRPAPEWSGLRREGKPSGGRETPASRPPA